MAVKLLCLTVSGLEADPLFPMMLVSPMIACLRSMAMFWRRVLSGLFGMLLLGVLSGCGAASDEEPVLDYPSLQTVPETPRPASSIEERRRIVQELIQGRQDSLRDASIVRSRSGFDVPSDAAPSDPGWDPELIVPEKTDGEADPFRLIPERGTGADSVYRNETKFEDGGLGDFIRDLERDTSPEGPVSDEEFQLETPPQDDTADGDQSSLEPPLQPVLLAAFAPALTPHPLHAADIVIRLAADDEKSWFEFLGDMTLSWLPGWGNDDEETASTEDEGTGDQGADQGQELTPEEIEQAIEDDGETMLSPVGRSLEKLRDFVRERRGEDTSPSPDDVPPFRADAIRKDPPIPESRPERTPDVTIEDQGESFSFFRTPIPHRRPKLLSLFPPRNEGTATASSSTSAQTAKTSASKESETPPEPVAANSQASAEKAADAEASLRANAEKNGAKSEPSPDVAGSSGDRPASEGAAPSRAAPSSKPEEQTLANAENEEPVSTSPSSPPAVAAGKEPSAKPEFKPVTEPEAAREQLMAQDQEVPAIKSAALEPGADVNDPGLPSRPYIIYFEPQSDALPEGAKLQLIAILAKARAYDQKLHIIGEASVNALARERANIVGHELVQLGAAADLLEFHYDAIAGADQVKLIIRPAPVDQGPAGGAAAKQAG